MIRADTIDLQDPRSPSAQDHNHVADSGPMSPIAPHQAETLREIAHETAEDEARSPRVSLTSAKPTEAPLELSADDASLSGRRRGDMHQDDLQQQQQDMSAIAQNGATSSSDEGDLDGDDSDLEDDMMDKISSSPSIEDEDIDFEFVYALHTFVATVEGQANATKGDTMVLLDDSNSYWWLVRVVKDSSIGYLPAEHIETPTERLARLNKHRNIDLSATMLGDQAQKPKNSFKAIRRRRKTVAFAEPTYVDYPEMDYSSDDDTDEMFGPSPPALQQQVDRQTQEQQAVESRGAADDGGDGSGKMEPLKARGRKADWTSEAEALGAEGQDEGGDSDDLVEETGNGTGRSRKGTVRNTDSFFKDESVETKKITLTPNLLRDNNSTPDSSDSTAREVKTEKMDKELVADKEKKRGKDKERKDKDKKPSAIRSFFSRKDKKKAVDDDDESIGKRSIDTVSDSRESDEGTSPDRTAGSQRSQTKLQKIVPLVKKPGVLVQKSVDLSSYLAQSRTNDVSNVPPASMRLVDSSSGTQHQRSASVTSTAHDEQAASKAMAPRSASAAPDAKLQQTVQARARMDLDASDSSETEQEQPRQASALAQLPGAFPASSPAPSSLAASQQPQQQARRQQQEPAQPRPMQSSPVRTSNPPPLVADTSSPEGDSPNASPCLEKTTASANSKESSSWNDAKLRAFFDEPDNVRHLLTLVYDKTHLEPVASDHPVMGTLFREQNAKLAEITTQLDNMLGDWLARKQRLRGPI
ncbi:hypothetical protein CDD81_1100 [Ophiocordyceps australis]|uniref:SH3 domain-containing protein n=1 Tax=Ophiocordyceps australis TaxID=1399860 RepID=A0A2C5XZN6_9HYPO|nr:hypothetical protein CDD81_1100 [Ophiocordyceps australis]